MAKIETIRQLCKVFFLNVGRAFPISWREKRLATNKKKECTHTRAYILYIEILFQELLLSYGSNRLSLLQAVLTAHGKISCRSSDEDRRQRAEYNTKNHGEGE